MGARQATGMTGMTCLDTKVRPQLDWALSFSNMILQELFHVISSDDFAEQIYMA